MTRREELSERALPPNSNPDGWVLEMWVDHVHASTELLGAGTSLDALADRQADLAKRGDWWEILIFDGDTGVLTLRMGSDPLDDYSGRLV